MFPQVVPCRDEVIRSAFSFFIIQLCCYTEITLRNRKCPTVWGQDYKLNRELVRSIKTFFLLTWYFSSINIVLTYWRKICFLITKTESFCFTVAYMYLLWCFVFHSKLYIWGNPRQTDCPTNLGIISLLLTS